MDKKILLFLGFTTGIEVGLQEMVALYNKRCGI